MQFGTEEAFFTSMLVGNVVRCPACGRDTGCNKTNMIYRSGQGSRSKSGFKGEDTTPPQVEGEDDTK